MRRIEKNKQITNTVSLIQCDTRPRINVSTRAFVKLREPALNIWKNSVRVISPKNLIKTYLKPISRYVDIYTLLIKL